MEDQVRKELESNIINNPKVFVIKYEGKIITGYNGKYLYKSKQSASQSLSYRFYDSTRREIIKNLKKSNVITIEEIDFNNISLSEDELLQKYINEKLK